jgi:PAS domain S-box-containing protein
MTRSPFLDQALRFKRKIKSGAHQTASSISWVLALLVFTVGKKGGLMAEKPTYAELEQTIKKLENEAARHERPEKTLDLQRRELLSVFDGINEPIYICDPDTHELLYANAATQAVFGPALVGPDTHELLYANAATQAVFGPALVGQKCYHAFQGSDKPCDFCTNPIIFGEKLGDSYIWEFRNRRNGRWYRCIDRAMRWPDGRMVRYEIAIDIHDLKLAQEAVQESEEKYRTLVENANEAILVVQDGEFKFANRRTWELTGYSEEELLSRPFIELVHPEDQEVAVGLYLRKVNSKKNHHIHPIRIVDKDCNIKWIEAGTALISWEGAPATLYFLNDISKRKQAETNSRQLQRQLVHVMRVATIGEITASVVHELNQPCTAILNNAQAAQRFLAADPPDLDEVREALRDIIDDDKRAAEVMQRLRSLLRKGEVTRKPLDLGEAIREIVPLLRREFAGNQISMHFELPSGLPPVSGDQIELQQVVVNLVVNACEAMTESEPGPHELVVSTFTDQSHNVVVAVRDSGPGLDGKTADCIFDPFYTTKSEGMGMGLSISRSIIKAHGGSLWGTNNPDRGATFYFTVPISDGDEA